MGRPVNHAESGAGGEYWGESVDDRRWSGTDCRFAHLPGGDVITVF